MSKDGNLARQNLFNAKGLKFPDLDPAALRMQIAGLPLARVRSELRRLANLPAFSKACRDREDGGLEEHLECRWTQCRCLCHEGAP
jgi:hypothetical protein